MIISPAEIKTLDQDIVSILRKLPRNEALASREIYFRMANAFPRTVVESRVMALASNGTLIQHDNAEYGFCYSLAPLFRARHFVPVFAGFPEWLVEHADGTQLALCHSEFHAKLIAMALNGEKS